AGLFLGRWVIPRIPQKWFDTLVLGFALVAALRLLTQG
ncbi:MAG: sulfite exporter TauE/SafE family protein, partial [Verrucomicrobia bacterium]|nr:sulfite exporter TauE/SafE family protein [Verrucomicrobiota bacterium]